LSQRIVFGISAIILYLIIIVCLSAISNRCYYEHLNTTDNDKRYKFKLTTVYVLLFSFIFAVYNKILTENSLHDGLVEIVQTIAKIFTVELQVILVMTFMTS